MKLICSNENDGDRRFDDLFGAGLVLQIHTVNLCYTN
jgi:hypothetical protein